MKKTLAIAMVVLFAVSMVFAAGSKETASAKSTAFHVGIVTGTVSQSEDDLRGAEKLIEEYGD